MRNRSASSALTGAGLGLCVYGFASLAFRLLTVEDYQLDPGWEEFLEDLRFSWGSLVLGAILVITGLLIAQSRRD